MSYNSVARTQVPTAIHHTWIEVFIEFSHTERMLQTYYILTKFSGIDGFPFSFRYGTSLHALCMRGRSAIIWFLSSLAYSQGSKAVCYHWRKDEWMMVRSFLLFLYKLGAEGTGFDTCYIPFFIFSLCFIKHCYDKEEFDTDCSYGFLKRLKKILWSVILKMLGAYVCEEWSFKYHITGKVFCFDLW